MRWVYPDKLVERDIAAAARAALGSASTFRILIALDGSPGPDTDRLVRVAAVAAAGRRQSEVVLSRLLPEGPTAAADPAGLEFGAGLLPDLSGMARAKEELEIYASTADVGPARITTLCRFGADAAAGLCQLVEASAADVVVVGEGWTGRERDAFLALDAVTVLVAADDPSEGAEHGETRGATFAVSRGGGVMVSADGTADGSRAVAIAARAATAARVPLTVVAADIGDRARRRLGGALDPLRSVGVEIAVFSADALSRLQLGKDVVAAARVVDRNGGSAINLRDEVSGLVKDSAAPKEP